MLSDARRDRYKDTAVLSGPRGRYFAPWQPPDELMDVPQRAMLVHRIVAAEVGFPDLIAVRYYGPGSEDLWWVIAYVNGIRDPDREMVVGQSLLVIPRELVLPFLERGG